MKIKHLLENESDNEYYGEITARIFNYNGSLDQLNDAVYNASMAAGVQDFKPIDEINNVNYTIVMDPVSNLRLAIRRVMIMVNMFRSFDGIDVEYFEFNVIQGGVIIERATLDNIETFISKGYTTEAELIHVIDN